MLEKTLNCLLMQVRLVSLSDCRGKSPMELQQFLVAELNASCTRTSLWSLHGLQGEATSTADCLSNA